ncbi:MAG: hypothetical protein COT92_02190 [Candidatus Doudnabacteria bacterium CG10_big_fil_rev_8_21_14_0_10_42_18]|uniref:AtpZ/AtpI family protein n=1 Tax=Candidatus Doudnabacteria bacterium CG10_big_fil_rev_8_21_14_0_10_42_18 TaxID=1974552 RepID=A0A2H0VAU6_9BACT|nr:MAG: hypothetical protein COT92_02190 [Candidatus Doudnabacteria bacterium CG10_big_fil_rev_8_21_14_0_10_42_18]
MIKNLEQKPEQKKTDKSKNFALYGLLMELGIEFAVMIGFPLYLFIKLGQWADKKQDSGYFVLIGILLALTLSSYMIYKRVKTVKHILK